MKIDSKLKAFLPLVFCSSLFGYANTAGAQEIIDSKDSVVEFVGLSDTPNQDVEFYCQGEESVFPLGSARSDSKPDGNFNDIVYGFSFSTSLAESCWRHDDDENSTPAAGETRRFQSHVLGKINGEITSIMTRKSYENCVLSNGAVDSVANCAAEDSISVLAERKLPFVLGQIAKAVYLDGTRGSADQQKESRNHWLAANGYSELDYWKGNQHYSWFYYMRWEVSLSLSDDGKSAVVAFAGSEPPEQQTDDFGRTRTNWGDISDWYFDTWVDLMPAKDSRYANEEGEFESLCQQYDCMLHSGFLAYTSNFWLAAKQEGALLDQLRTLKSNGLENLYITGHSLGGSMAAVFSSYYEAERRVDTLPSISKVVTFGSPMVGNNNFKSLYRDLELDERTVYFSANNDPGSRYPRDLHPCDSIENIFSTVCWGFAAGWSSYSSWMQVKDLYVPLGMEVLMRRDDTGVTMSEGHFAPWENIDLEVHAMSNYFDLLTGCEKRSGCWYEQAN